MRIKSSFRDYYDSIQAYGMSSELEFRRVNFAETVEAESRWHLFLDPPGIDHNHGQRTHVLGFCGTVFPIIEVRPVEIGNASFNRDTPCKPNPDWMVHSPEAMDSKMEELLDGDDFNKYASGSMNSRYEWFSRRRLSTSRGWKKFFEDFAKPDHQKRYAGYFEKSPMFVMRSDNNEANTAARQSWQHLPITQKIEFNPKLLLYNFGKIKDPYTAYQEVYQFVANQPGEERPQMEMSNEETAARLGHGDKYSFRSPPGKKKRKQK